MDVEKETVVNTINNCVLFMDVVQFIGALLVAGLKESKLHDVKRRNCMIYAALDVLSQPRVQTC